MSEVASFTATFTVRAIPALLNAIGSAADWSGGQLADADELAQALRAQAATQPSTAACHRLLEETSEGDRRQQHLTRRLIDALDTHQILGPLARQEAPGLIEDLRDRLATSHHPAGLQQTARAVEDLIDTASGRLAAAQSSTTLHAMGETLQELGFDIQSATEGRRGALWARRGDQLVAAVTDGAHSHLEITGCQGPSCQVLSGQIADGLTKRGIEPGPMATSYPDPDPDPDLQLIAPAAAHASQTGASPAQALLHLTTPTPTESPQPSAPSQAARRRTAHQLSATQQNQT